MVPCSLLSLALVGLIELQQCLEGRVEYVPSFLRYPGQAGDGEAALGEQGPDLVDHTADRGETGAVGHGEGLLRQPGPQVGPA